MKLWNNDGINLIDIILSCVKLEVDIMLDPSNLCSIDYIVTIRLSLHVSSVVSSSDFVSSHIQDIKDICSQSKTVGAALKKGIKDLDSLEKVLTQSR